MGFIRNWESYEEFEAYLESLKNDEDEVDEKQTDPKLVQNIEDEGEEDVCPRCGKGPNDCICQDRDAFSTINLYRAPKGKKKEKDD